MKATKLAIWAVALMVLLVAYAASASDAAGKCSFMELKSCTGSAAKPSKMCCTKLKEQKPCLCQFNRDPKYAKYRNSIANKIVARACGMALPKC